NLRSPDEWLRAWTLQLAFESQDNLERLVRGAHEGGRKVDTTPVQLAATDPSPIVRRFLASAVQRSQDDQFRRDVVQRLVLHGEAAPAHNLPLMYGFAAEPLVAQDPGFAETLLTTTKIPQLRPLIARRLTAASQSAAAKTAAR